MRDVTTAHLVKHDDEWTMADIAEEAGVSTNTISRWITGKRHDPTIGVGSGVTLVFSNDEAYWLIGRAHMLRSARDHLARYDATKPDSLRAR